MKKFFLTASTLFLLISLTGCTETEVSQYNQLKLEHPELVKEYEATSSISPEAVEKLIQADPSISDYVVQVERSTLLSVDDVESDGAVAGSELVSVDPEVAEPEVTEPAYEEIVVGEVAEGNIITFGRYEQDNNLDNGPEPIEWSVFEVADGKVTLFPTKCMMWGSGLESNDLLNDFNSTAFNEDEQKLMVGPAQFISEELLAKSLNLITAQSTFTAYAHDSRFEFMKSYTESAVAAGAKLRYTTVGGININDFLIWTEECYVTWRDSNNSMNHNIVVDSGFDRSVNTYYSFGICPYIVIYTNELLESEVD